MVDNWRDLDDWGGDRTQVLWALKAAREQVQRSNAEVLFFAAHLADLYSDLDEATSVTLPGCEDLVLVGSDGTPAVAEFATLEVAAMLGMRHESVTCLVADALDVRHRLPWVWKQLSKLTVLAWQARALAGLTRDLPLDACLFLDAELPRLLPGVNWPRVVEYVKARVLELLPEEERQARYEAAQERRHVTVWESVDGISAIDGAIDTGDAVLLNAQLNRYASILHQGGREGTTKALRAQALGVLANPALALQLAQASLLDELPEERDEFEECLRAGQPGHACGAVTVDPEKLLPKAELVVHLTDHTLHQGSGVTRVERIGPILTEWTQQLLGHRRVSIRPVIDAGHLAASDSYEVPETMRQAIRLRHRTEVFPWSTKPASRCDLDHTTPYVTDGPPGQTNTANLGPLSRTVHRAKTHGGWHLEQPIPGTYLWTSPLGMRYLVTPSHTIALDPLDACDQPGRQPQHAAA